MIEALEDLASVFGRPFLYVTDDGPSSRLEFDSYCSETGTPHVPTSAYHPSSNGSSERAVQKVKSLLKRIEGSDTSLCDALVQLRSQPVYGRISSSEVMFGRQLRNNVVAVYKPLSQDEIKGEQKLMDQVKRNNYEGINKKRDRSSNQDKFHVGEQVTLTSQQSK